MKPTISLILATVNRTSELDRLFLSLAAQSCHDFDIIVIDQNTDDRLKPHLKKALLAGLKIQHIKHWPPNLAAARNAGMAASNALWFGFADDDCWYDSKMIEKIIQRINRVDQPKGVIAHWVELGDPISNVAQLSWNKSRQFRDIPVSSITLFFHRQMLETIGGFDSRLGIGQWFGAAEETDWVLRALRTGALIAYEPAAKVHHHVNFSTKSNPTQDHQAERKRARGTGALYAKHNLPLWVILRGFISPLIKPILRGKIYSSFNEGIPVMKGRLAGFIRWKYQQNKMENPHV